GRELGIAERAPDHRHGGAPDLFRVVLDPARLREDLRQLSLRRRARHTVLAKEDGARARRPLIDGEQTARPLAHVPVLPALPPAQTPAWRVFRIRTTARDCRPGFSCARRRSAPTPAAG